MERATRVINPLNPFRDRGFLASFSVARKANAWVEVDPWTIELNGKNAPSWDTFRVTKGRLARANPKKVGVFVPRPWLNSIRYPSARTIGQFLRGGRARVTDPRSMDRIQSADFFPRSRTSQNTVSSFFSECRRSDGSRGSYGRRRTV